YIFIDIDGTLLNSEGKVPESATQAILKAQENGHKVFVNTGRSKSGMPTHVSEMPFDGFVYSAGTVIEIDKEQIFFDAMSADEIKNLQVLVEDSGLGYSLEGYQRSFYDDKSEKIFDSLNFMDSKPGTLLHLNHFDHSRDHINKLALFSYHMHAYDVLRNQLPEHLSLIVHDKTIHGLYLAEIIKKTSNKATGVQKVLEHFGGDKADTICFGDSPNDLDM
ncbi:HAD-superfamily hydrolase, subfamily IIB like protein, partial [Aduncisulcus paluster]